MNKGVLAALGGAAVLAVAAVVILRPGPSNPTPVPAPAATPSAKATPVDSAARLKLAVAAAFPQGERVQSDDTAPVTFDDHKLVDATFGPVLVSHGHVEDASHAEAGTIRVDYLAERDDGFRVVQSFPKVIETGSHGDLSEWAVSDKFSDLPVVYAQGGGTFQGYTCGASTLVELKPSGPVELVSFPDVYDNGDAVETGAQSIGGKIADIVKGNGFVVHYTGTSRFDERYVRRGERFVLQGGPSRLPSC